MKNKNKTLPAALKRSAGYTLVGTMVAVLIAGTLAVGGTYLYNDYKLDQSAQGRAKQIGMALTQLDKFAHKYQDPLTSGQAISGVANPYSPTTAEMQTLGFAAAGFSDGSQPGGALAFIIAREPAGCAPAKCILALKAVTSQSVQFRGSVNPQFAQKIASYVPNSAGWSNIPNDATKLGKNGLTIPNPLGNVPTIVAAVTWLGNNKESQTVPPISYNYRTLACSDPSYTGQINQQQGTSTDKYGNQTTGPWTTYSDTCAAPVATGTFTQSQQTATCPAGYSGYQDQQRMCTTYNNGTTSCGGWSVSADHCSAPPPPPPPVCSPTYMQSSSAAACPGGQVGSITTYYQTNSCTGAVSQTNQTSSCACPSGTNWDGNSCQTPVAPPPPPPPPPSCPAATKWCEQMFTNTPYDDPMRDAWYEYGSDAYEGPTCETVRYTQGQMTGGCPPGWFD